MTITQSDWKTRLGVRFTVDGNETRVFLAQSYVPTFGTSAAPQIPWAKRNATI